MKRILAGVDGSDPSVRAARRAAEMAPRLALRVALVHVAPDHSMFAEWQLGGDETEIHRLRDEESNALLRRVAAQLPGPAPELVCLCGTPAETLAAEARKPDVELVVVGSRGRTLIGGVLIGSVAHRLVHICEKPILIVH